MEYKNYWLHLLLLTMQLPISWTCPNSCVCKWKNGKQTVECAEKGLLVIPEGMDSGTQVLEFSGNNLRTLQREKFLKLDLTNLQRIYLSRCRITIVDDHTFKGLTNLVELDLSGNSLEMVPSEAFGDCPSLMKLTLSSNPIKAISVSAFGHLPYLNTLELSNCEIMEIEEGAFQGLHSLEWLRLNGNRLTTLKGTKVLPENLRGVELQGNLWQCDCHLIDLRTWLDTEATTSGRATSIVTQTTEPICVSGLQKLHRKPVRSIPLGDFACLPDVSPTTFYLEIGEGKNVSLICHVTAIPEARVSWWFQGQLLQNDTMITSDTRLMYFIEEGGEDKRSELFIYNMNSLDNGTFVCSAENPAGVVQSNFTIRVILKEETPRYAVVALPFEFLLIIASAVGVSLLAILFALVLSCIKCRVNSRKRSQQQKRHTLAMHNATKDSLLQDSTEEYSELSKVSSNITLVDRHQQMLYSSSEEVISPTLTQSNVTTSSPPINLNYYQHAPVQHISIDQNPDLINDTETIGRRLEGDGEDVKQENEATELKTSTSSFHQLDTARTPQYRMSADIHLLNPVGLLNSRNPGNFGGSCYRTLPYNRAAKRQHSFTYSSREAEFQFLPEVRHTADGYPVARGTDLDSLETQFSDTESVRSCASVPASWPIRVGSEDVTLQQLPRRACVGAQTQTETSICNSGELVSAGVQTNGMNGGSHKPLNRIVSGVKVAETLTESPDEGYEGEVVEIRTKH